MTMIETDIVVAGTGPAGMIAALSLAAEGFSVALAGPQANLADRRTSALMKPSLDVLEWLGLLDAVRGEAAPLRAMRIVDATNRLLRSPVVTFRAAEIDEAFFGLNIPNRHLLAVLDAAASASTAIRRVEGVVTSWNLDADRAQAVMEDGRAIAARLAVAADGRASTARQAAGIRVDAAKGRQSALVLNFGHTRGHDDISTEFHTEEGPFTVVPLPGRRSSLVWVSMPERVEKLVGLSDDDLAAAIEERMQSMLGRVTLEPGRQVYPLSSAIPRRFAANRVALVGEAAHIFPPIGAQGLNLGIRDVEDLTRLARDHASDPGAPEALSAYERARRPDILARSSAVNLLNRSLLSDMLPAQAARAAGLGLLGAVAPLRAFFMREGLRTGTGLGRLFATSGK